MRQPRPDPARGRLRHAVGGRARISLAAPVPAKDDLDVIAADAAAIPAVRGVDVRARTGSLILHHDGPLEHVLAELSEAGLLELLPDEPAAPVDPIGTAKARLAEADRFITRVTAGRADLSGTTFAGLVAAGLVQLARGRAFGPALTIFGQAATLALMKTASAPAEPGSDAPRQPRTPSP
ncbi:hypothetical protein [Acuticoccus mangrovi]|uniref:Uncharacterized protein n=1 Tax=Acuticoccus mangrovi TaxID=2796142 RepID=A0A934MDP4_9HYPH|nr:hypothetical protein [Acuticoccus mangrovi]MBJ3776592.1 hypothetical protein [Acuticoccus mangrovi]